MPSSERLSPLQHDLLNHLVNGVEVHADGTPMRWGAWMGACAEYLEDLGYVERRACRYVITPAGREALAAAEGRDA